MYIFYNTVKLNFKSSNFEGMKSLALIKPLLPRCIMTLLEL